MQTGTARRPLKSRDTAWAKATAQALLRAGITPNTISVFSVVFAACAGLGFSLLPRAHGFSRVFFLVAAVAGIQLRLICNLLDGMVAIEGGKKTKAGDIFNDLPDRVADFLILIPAGYGIHALPFSVVLGWSAGLLSILTAYVRMLGGSLGLQQDFRGPMAKQQRMAVLTVACLLSLFETHLVLHGTALWIALVIINLGCVVTVWRRVAGIVRELESR